MQSKIVEVVDRESAIKTAFFMAHPYGIILIAGKGHETYQEIAGRARDRRKNKTKNQAEEMRSDAQE